MRFPAKLAATLALTGISGLSFASNLEISGVADVDFSYVDGGISYLDGGYGKFGADKHGTLALSQVSLLFKAGYRSLEAVVTTHGYFNDVKDAAGLSEAYLQYKSLPTQKGYRFKTRLGWMYPRVSMTNSQTGWTSPYTKSYSMINSWVGEELRHRGVEFSVTRLGKYTKSPVDVELSATVFDGNDPAGAVLSWHGWNMTDRVSLRDERLTLPEIPPGFVPDSSDVFLELDNRVGYHLVSSVGYGHHARILLGHYDNRGDPRVVNDDVQWAWETKFTHMGAIWNFPGKTKVIVQWLEGSTLMQNTSGTFDLVNNDYASGFLLVSKKFGNYRPSIRAEYFKVEDFDTVASDNNEEDGIAFTANITWRPVRHLNLYAEYNWVDSDRPSRLLADLPVRFIERKTQVGMRYLF